MFYDFTIRQKGTLAGNICSAVELPIDNLKAQVGHSHIIGIGESQRYPELTFMRLTDAA